MSRRFRPLVLAGALAVALALTGCTSSSDDLAKQYNAGDSKGYIAGDGSVTEIPVDEREDPVEFDGTIEDGSEVSSADYAGEVVVVNFWYASCARAGPKRPTSRRSARSSRATVPVSSA